MARTKQTRIEELEEENALLKDHAADLTDDLVALGEESRKAHQLVGRLAVENACLRAEIAHRTE